MADPGPHHFLQYSQELQHWKASHLKFTTGSGNCVIAKARQARTDLFLSSFPIFSSLPIELRLRIWRLFNVPAVLTWNNNHHFGAGGPVTLYVNRESRHEALRTYTKFTAPLALTDLSPMSYFNFDIDVIYNDGYSPSSVVPAFAPMIKRYAVGLKEVVPEMPVWFVRLYMEQRIAKFWIQIAENFPNLEELIIITDPYPFGRFELQDFVEVVSAEKIKRGPEDLSMMDLGLALSKAQAGGKLQGVTLKLMKVET